MQTLRDKLFRKVALERLSSPEQLDDLMRVVPPLGWVVLVPLLALIVMALLWGWFGSVATKVAGRCILMSPAGLADVQAPAGGRIADVLVRAGDTVKANQVVVRLADTASDEQHTAATSLHDGRVIDVKVGVGSLVAAGSSLMTIERTTDADGRALQAVIYVPAGEAAKMRAGMTAQILPSTASRERHGFVLGEVTRVADYPASAQGMVGILRNEVLARELSANAPVTEVRATLLPDEGASGYRWTSREGASLPVKSGTLCTAEIVLAEERPLALVVPVLGKSAPGR